MNYVADIDIDHISFVHRFSFWDLGLMAGVLRSGDILRTTEFNSNGTGDTFSADQVLVGVSIGRRLTDRFAFAGTVKVLQENLDEFENRGVFVDLGAIYYFGFRNARMGFTVRNFGGDLRLNSSPPADAETGQPWQGFPAPTQAVFGIAYDFKPAHVRRLTTSLDFNHPSDETESIIWGAELELNQGLFLRGGYENGVEDGGKSIGFGLKVFRKSMPMHFSYAFQDQGSFGLFHVISLEMGK